MTLLPAVRAATRAWTVFYAQQAAAIGHEPLHVRFLGLEPELTVPVHLVVRPERRALGRRIACEMVAGSGSGSGSGSGVDVAGGRRPTVTS